MLIFKITLNQLHQLNQPVFIIHVFNSNLTNTAERYLITVLSQFTDPMLFLAVGPSASFWGRDEHQQSLPHLQRSEQKLPAEWLWPRYWDYETNIHTAENFSSCNEMQRQDYRLELWTSTEVLTRENTLSFNFNRVYGCLFMFSRIHRLSVLATVSLSLA